MIYVQLNYNWTLESFGGLTQLAMIFLLVLSESFYSVSGKYKVCQHVLTPNSLVQQLWHPSSIGFSHVQGFPNEARWQTFHKWYVWNHWTLWNRHWLLRFRHQTFFVRFRHQNHLVRFRHQSFFVRFRYRNYLVMFRKRAWSVFM